MNSKQASLTFSWSFINQMFLINTLLVIPNCWYLLQSFMSVYRWNIRMGEAFYDWFDFTMVDKGWALGVSLLVFVLWVVQATSLAYRQLVKSTCEE